jgi:hypothetical protein
MDVSIKLETTDDFDFANVITHAKNITNPRNGKRMRRAGNWKRRHVTPNIYKNAFTGSKKEQCSIETEF